MRWYDRMTGSTWEVVEPAGTRIYSPSGLGGTPNFLCRCVEWTPEAERWKEQAREDGCIVFCGDSIASMLLCRSDGRCQYAIDHGAEGLGHCPRGKCAMPDGA